MTDVFTKAKRSEIMSRIRSKNTKLEINFFEVLSARLYRQGIRYRKHYKKLKGCPDIAFVADKVAVFLDGEFWHGYSFKERKKTLPKKYWIDKIRSNIGRDRRTNAWLKRNGWKVLRFWEHELVKHPEKAIDRIESALR